MMCEELIVVAGTHTISPCSVDLSKSLDPVFWVCIHHLGQGWWLPWSFANTTAKMALSKQSVESYLREVDLGGPLEASLNAAVSMQTLQPLPFFANYFSAKALLASFG
jgi:hypothetical protein